MIQAETAVIHLIKMAGLERKLRRALVGQEKLDALTGVYSFDPERISSQELDQLRRTIFREYETPAFIATWVKKNTSSTRDEVYNSLFSFVLIDDSEWTGETVNFLGEYYMGSFQVTMNGSGEMVRIRDIGSAKHTNGLRLISAKRDPIVYLRENEDIDLVLYVKRGTGKDNVCYYPHRFVYVVPPETDDDLSGFRFVIKSRGLDPDEIFEKSLTLVTEANW